MACASGAKDSAFGSDAALPNLAFDTGATPQCVNLECLRASCVDGKHTTVSGTVYDPAGQSPLYNAIVYVPNSEVEPFTAGVACDRCGAAASGNPIVVTLTDEHGRFVLEDVPVTDDLPLVIQVGRWRRQIRVGATACQDNPVEAAQTHLPRNSGEGDIPLVAIVTGAFDPLECLMRKIGIDDAEFTGDLGEGRVHLFRGFGGGGVPGSRESEMLYGQLRRYDAVLLACEGDTYPDNKPLDATYEMRDYLDKGGRVFATHFQYYWFAPFPDGAGVRPLPSVAVWDQRAGMNDTIDGVIDRSFPKGQAYFDWLNLAQALDSWGLLTIQEARHDVNAAVPNRSQSWIRSDVNAGDPAAIQILSFNTPVDANPEAQCGRAVFSDMHVASQDYTSQRFPEGCITKGLSSQEKALEFMLFDLSSCVQREDVPPIPPSQPLK